ncbi:MAG: CoA transferase [Betaproteobacteria bacterium]|uniref:CoA transferase n=1 Tax=Candidatus Proximibacter danicus TaxID=2954365 RepID=A0A9D7JZ35_9PROT|nr:CoA transferase [Candidatus Proximibacter danicus]
MSKAPLSGVRVLDLSRLLPGPVASLHLADLGADVIKIEDTGVGDYARTMGDGPDGLDGTSFFFRAVNRNKRGLTLDLKQAQGREALLRLVAGADILLESFRPGVMERLGLGYETLRASNPRLVYCAITGYGQDGPWALRAGHDLNYIAQAGVLEQTGTAGGPPAIPALQIGDLLGGAMTAVSAMLAALFKARATGEGSFVDVAMSDSVLAHNLFPLFALQAEGALSPRGGDLLTGGHANYGVYRTQDGKYMAVAPLEEKFWVMFCDAVGRPELKARYAETAAPELRIELENLFASRPQAEWTALFDQVDCCITPVLTLPEALAHPQTQARGMPKLAMALKKSPPCGNYVSSDCGRSP